MRSTLGPPRYVLAIFVGVAVVSAAALGGLMWLLLDQDQTVEMQRQQDHLEQVADRATAIMQSALSDLDPASNLPSDVLAVTINSNGLFARPEHSLLYFPELQRYQTPSTVFADGEREEFARNNLQDAARIYSQIAAASENNLRAGALTRLARVRRKLKQYDEAIRVYDQLARIAVADVSGLPAALIAREGRTAIFEETNNASELRKEAAAFEAELQNGEWQLTKSEYEFYSAEAKAWLGKAPKNDETDDAVAVAEAVGWVWENRKGSEPNFRRLIYTGNGVALVVSRATSDGLSDTVAGSKYLASLCREAVADGNLRCTLSDAEGRAVVGLTPPARNVAVRTASAAKLPWTLQVFRSADAVSAKSSSRRNLLLWVAAVLGFVWLTGAGFIVRAIRHETRVAQLQSDFVAAVSHEFRSPLSSVCQISEMLAGDRLESEEVRRNAYGVLIREADRLRRLVEGLLDFQRFEAGKVVYHFEPLEIGEFLKSVVSDFQTYAADAGYTIQLRALDSTVFVQADREAFGRAIWNLLDNAMKYSPEHHTVWVDVGRDRNHISIAVQDRGLGIPIQEQSEIFEKFVRGADSKSRRIKGTGIGLAMVRHIVQAHGGEIVLNSRPGEGSRFTMVLPQRVKS